ncbi:MAG: hypothetical protein COB66_08205 [Coxiella sp. (in: Bacteria)]|nr:MAG: hypothetical protein COB66_08205 [Coxiella sp. (in: g-proteobacteria)]
MKLRHFAFAALSLVTASALAAPAPANFTPPQKKAIQKIVRDYLINNPQVLVESFQVLQTQRAKQKLSKSELAIKANAQQLFHDPNTPSVGSPKAKVYIAEFFDYQCGHCRAVAPTIERIIKKDKNVKFFFKELPIFGGASKYAAKAGLAANAQGKYMPYHRAVFSATDVLTEQKVQSLAQKAGLNVAKLTTEMNKPEYEAQIRANFALAEKLGIMGTPAFVISNKAGTKFQFFPGAVDEATLQKGIAAVQSK